MQRIYINLDALTDDSCVGPWATLLLARLMGQYCFISLASVVCRRRLSSVGIVCRRL